jgi:aspartate/methionine/tyrosine aminotransferase
LGVKSVEFAESLLKEKKILVRPGLAFGQAGEYHLRVPLIKPVDVLERVTDVIEEQSRSLAK